MTIKDIARESGYGVGTVSRVLNGQANVSEEAREAIMAVVRKYDFQPNTNAKQLKQVNGGSIAIVVKGIGNMLFVSLLENLQHFFQTENRAVSVYYINETDDEVSLAIQVIRETKPVGILFLGASMQNLTARFQEITLPCVLISAQGSRFGFPNLSSVTTDDIAGSACAMDYLLDSGHRKIGVIAGTDCLHRHPNGVLNMGQQRLTGCKEACARRSVPFDWDRQLEITSYTADGGYQGAEALLDRIPDLTAILATTDVAAAGAVRAICDRGLRVPEDISVIGFDGIPFSRFLCPRLATIQQDTGRMAQRATEIMLNLLDGKATAVHELVPYKLIPGESVKKL